MEPIKKVLSGGEHPIYLYGSDDGSAKVIVHDEAEESQAWSEPHDELALSSTSDEQVLDPRPSGEEIGAPPQRKLIVALRQKEIRVNNRAVRRTRHLLGSDLASNAASSSNGARDQSDEGLDSFEQSGSESESTPSSASDDLGLGDHQVGLTGQQFQDGNEPIPDFNDDSDLDAVKNPEIEVSAAVIAPFRDGGLPNIPRRYLTVGEPSEITDFGELMYAKNRKTRSRKSTGSLPSRTGERRSAKKTLQERLFQALLPTHQGKKEFFPKNVISTIITEQCVREELSKELDADAYNKKAIAEYARRICEEKEFGDNSTKKIRCFRKIFVILVLIEKTPAIIKFLEKDVNDSDLPLEKVERPHEKGSYDLRLSRNRTKRLKCFSKKWNQLHIRNFEGYQWTTLSPFFGKGGHKIVKHYPLQDQVILPFISAIRRDRSSTHNTLEFEGGFGRVFKVDIHPDHHNFDGHNVKTQNPSFAIKCLHSRDTERFKKEVEMLKKFSNPAHEHLISLLATYEQFKSYFLIFHWADADLQRYWRDVNPTPSMNRETVIWVAKQCKGVADGIVKIHQYRTSSSKLQVQPQNEVFGHHGDIKPENVLWFPDADHEQTKRGTLKLSDFGLAEFSMHQTRSMNPKSNFATSPPYRAPEVDLEGTGAIGRSYDIWTLGCLYLEFITWLIGGWDLVDSFAFRRMTHDPMLGHETRTFFRLVKIKTSDGKWTKGAEIKPVVTEFINELYAHEACTKFLRDFLDMVKDDLLVIQTHDRETRGRPTSQEVLKKLGDMLRNCEASESYACKSAPRLNALDEKAAEGNKSKGYRFIDSIDLPEATGSPVSGVCDTKQF
ncbi:hypothetical protein N431DRAFT_390007 [Stipitochalara longipes BDJ]|nr:hypothetical protein N431DRAFT_390007 [Stipitochalara longipes BDJ]